MPLRNNWLESPTWTEPGLVMWQCVIRLNHLFRDEVVIKRKPDELLYVGPLPIGRRGADYAAVEEDRSRWGTIPPGRCFPYRPNESDPSPLFGDPGPHPLYLKG